MPGQFADTSFWYARYVATDDNHSIARRVRVGPRVVTTEPVLGETWTLVNRRINHEAALRWVRAIRRLPGVVVAPLGERDHAVAWEWLARHDEREYSFVDALSFVLMRRMRLTETLAFDGDFSAAGFIERRP